MQAAHLMSGSLPALEMRPPRCGAEMAAGCAAAPHPGRAGPHSRGPSPPMLPDMAPRPRPRPMPLLPPRPDAAAAAPCCGPRPAAGWLRPGAVARPTGDASSCRIRFSSASERCGIPAAGMLAPSGLLSFSSMLAGCDAAGCWTTLLCIMDKCPSVTMNMMLPQQDACTSDAHPSNNIVTSARTGSWRNGQASPFLHWPTEKK